MRRRSGIAAGITIGRIGDHVPLRTLAIYQASGSHLATVGWPAMTLASPSSRLDNIRHSLVGLRMPRALEMLDATLRRIEQGQIDGVEALDELLTEELSLRENRHERWTFHFTPTSGSWLNAVETFFSALTRQRIRRGSFHSLVSLQAAIKTYLAERNSESRPFVWTAATTSILAELERLPASSVDCDRIGRAAATLVWVYAGQSAAGAYSDRSERPSLVVQLGRELVRIS